MKLTDQEVAWVFSMYMGCQIKPYQSEFTLSALLEKDDEFSVKDAVQKGFKLALTTIEKMSDEHCIEVCNAACPELYGDFRYKKWEVIDRCDNDGTYIKVARNGTDEYFTIHHITGEVCIWDSRFFSGCPMYSQVYFKHGIAVPLFFSPMHWANRKTAIELDIAVEKTEQ